MSENDHTQTSDTAAASTAVATPAPSAPPANAAPESAPATAKVDTAAPAKAQPRPEGNGRSSPEPKAVVTNRQDQGQPPASAKPQESPEERKARLEDQLAQRGRELAAMRSQTEQMNRQLKELQEFREKQTKLAETQKLKRWDPRHPDSSKFADLRRRVQEARDEARQIRVPPAPEGFSPEQAAAWEKQYRAGMSQHIASRFKPEEWDEFAAWEADQADFAARFHADPRGTLREDMRAVAQEVLQAERARFQSEQAVEQDMNDPELGPILKEHQAEMAEVLERLGNTDEAYEVTRHMARLYAQNQALSKRLAEQSQQVGTVEAKAKEVSAQQAAIKRRAATVTAPDLRPPPQRPLWDELKEWADKNGHSTDSEAFRQEAARRTQQRLKQ